MREGRKEINKVDMRGGRKECRKEGRKESFSHDTGTFILLPYHCLHCIVLTSSFLCCPYF